MQIIKASFSRQTKILIKGFQQIFTEGKPFLFIQMFSACRSGNRSKQASEKLAALGDTNIVEFGGINDWPGETISGNG